ncbi:hypothetical protein KKC13_09230 [bacterium]|nr:hypothetical protein [bacterium]MBU1957970.1 hypothetical protein [bacterium]
MKHIHPADARIIDLKDVDSISPRIAKEYSSIYYSSSIKIKENSLIFGYKHNETFIKEYAELKQQFPNEDYFIFGVVFGVV